MKVILTAIDRWIEMKKIQARDEEEIRNNQMCTPSKKKIMNNKILYLLDESDSDA